MILLFADGTPVQVDKDGAFILDGGVVRVGTTKEYQFLLANETKNGEFVDIKIEIVSLYVDSKGTLIDFSKELKIVEQPTILKASSRAPFVIQWTAPNAQRGLRVKFIIGYDAIWS